MKYSTLHEVAALAARDCYTLFSPAGKALQQPPHYHDEFELSLIPDARGLRFMAGEESYSFRGPALVLTAPGLPHAWESDDGSSGREVRGEVIRFPGDLLAQAFLGKSQLQGIDGLLQLSRKGVVFSPKVIDGIASRILALRQQKGFPSFLSLLSVLHELSLIPEKEVIAKEVVPPEFVAAGHARMNCAMAFMKANYTRDISLEEVAKTASMTRGAFCRLIRKRTGKTYLQSLNEIRIDHICQMLLNSSENIAEIAYKAGYNSITYFNRWFRQQKGCTPKEYREQFSPVMV